MPTKKELEQMLKDLEIKNNDLTSQNIDLKSEITNIKGKTSKNGHSHGQNIYVPKDRKFTTFDQSVDNVSEWFEDIEAYVESRFSNIHERTRFIIEKLPREIQRELRLLLEWPYVSVDEIKAHLIEAYTIQATPTQLQERFFARNQMKHEDIMSFSHALINLAKQINEHPSKIGGFTDKTIVLKQRLSEGVLDKYLSRELKRLLKEQPQQSFLEFRKAAIEWVSVGENQSKSVDSVRLEALGTNDVFKVLEKQQKQLDTLNSKLDSLASGAQDSPYPLATNTSKPKCTYCHKAGHTRERCFKLKPRIIACNYCKKTGHLAEKCFKRIKAEPPSLKSRDNRD